MIENHKDLFNNIDRNDVGFSQNEKQFLLEASNIERAKRENHSDSYELESEETEGYRTDKTQDVHHVIEEESLSIEEKEKELIEKALKKHKNKRKYAAEDLGISERTLYRKIKQYEI